MPQQRESAAENTVRVALRGRIVRVAAALARTQREPVVLADRPVASGDAASQRLVGERDVGIDVGPVRQALACRCGLSGLSYL